MVIATSLTYSNQFLLDGGRQAFVLIDQVYRKFQASFKPRENLLFIIVDKKYQKWQA